MQNNKLWKRMTFFSALQCTSKIELYTNFHPRLWKIEITHVSSAKFSFFLNNEKFASWKTLTNAAPLPWISLNADLVFLDYIFTFNSEIPKRNLLLKHNEKWLRFAFATSYGGNYSCILEIIHRVRKINMIKLICFLVLHRIQLSCNLENAIEEWSTWNINHLANSIITSSILA